jgi:hypothetical protein
MKIDLGQKNNSACCPPMVGGSSSEDKPHYPSLYFTHDKPVEFPSEGTALITFRKIESSENTRDPDDPKYRCELEIKSIEVKGGRSDKPDLGSELKMGMRKKLKVGEYEEED